MKICYIADGSSIHVTEWASYFQKKGHDVTIISDTNCHIEDVQVFNIGDCLPKIRIPVLSAFIQIQIKIRKIKKILKAIGPDIIHAHYATNYGFLSAKSKFHPFILTCHGSDLLIDPIKNKIDKYFVKFSLKKADLISAPTSQMVDIINKYGIVLEKIIKIQYGIDTDLFNADTSNKDTCKIVSSRHLSDKYRVDVLINAIPILASTYSNFKVIILNDGDKKEYLENLVDSKDIISHVSFIGKVTHTELIKYFQQSSIYISTCPTDSVSIALLEAMASFCFPVVTSIPANRELISLGFHIEFFEVNNPVSLSNVVKKVLKDLPNLKNQLHENYQLVIKHFSRKNNLNKFNHIYEKFEK